MDLPDKSVPTKQRIVKQAVIPKGAAQPTSRPASRRFLDHVFAESPKTLMGMVFKNVVEPRIKDGIYAAGQSFLHGMLFGGNQSPGTFGIAQGTVLRGGGVVMPTDYNAISSGLNPGVAAASAAGNLSGPYKDLKLVSVEVAERLLAEMHSNLNQYRVTTVADLYEAAQLTPADHMANYGWYSLDGARIQREGDGVKLLLPKPVRV